MIEYACNQDGHKVFTAYIRLKESRAMRLDKFLKVSRVIKRRTVACDACSSGRVSINDKVAKPSTAVKIGDVIKVSFGDNAFAFRVIDINAIVKKQDATLMYEILGGNDES